MCMYRKRFILRNWLMRLWRLASPKYSGWAGKAENLEELMLQFKPEGHWAGDQRRPSVAVQNLKAVCWPNSVCWLNSLLLERSVCCSV